MINLANVIHVLKNDFYSAREIAEYCVLSHSLISRYRKYAKDKNKFYKLHSMSVSTALRLQEFYNEIIKKGN